MLKSFVQIISLITVMLSLSFSLRAENEHGLELILPKFKMPAAKYMCSEASQEVKSLVVDQQYHKASDILSKSVGEGKNLSSSELKALVLLSYLTANRKSALIALGEQDRRAQLKMPREYEKLMSEGLARVKNERSKVVDDIVRLVTCVGNNSTFKVNITK